MSEAPRDSATTLTVVVTREELIELFERCASTPRYKPLLTDEMKADILADFLRGFDEAISRANREPGS